MGDSIGQVLPLAVGIAVSPIPIIASILMLMSPRARTTSVGFLIGWLLGIALAVSVFAALSSVLPDDGGDGPAPVVAIIQIVLGLVLLFLAVRQWRSRPRAGVESTMPGWMCGIDGMTFFPAAGLGLLLAAVNPKNLLLGASAGTALGSSDGGTGALIVTIVVFTVVAGSTVLIPVVGFLVASERLRGPLDRLREWLQQENAVIMTVLLLVLGVVVVSKGLTAIA